MIPYDYLMTLALLALAPESEISSHLIERHESLRPVVQHVALACEVMDQREIKYVLTRQEDFTSDLEMLRKRFQNLRGAPPVHDSVRFPSRKTVSRMLSFNREYRKYLTQKLAVDPTNAGIYREAVRETDRLYKIWDAIRDTRCEYYYVTVRRQALKNVVRLIGENNFYNGVYPPHVPVWRFRKID